MEVETIIYKTNLTQKEMEFVVEQYILEKTNKAVSIDVEKVIHPIFIGNQLSKLNSAYEIAVKYFVNKIETN